MTAIIACKTAMSLGLVVAFVVLIVSAVSPPYGSDDSAERAVRKLWPDGKRGKTRGNKYRDWLEDDGP